MQRFDQHAALAGFGHRFGAETLVGAGRQPDQAGCKSHLMINEFGNGSVGAHDGVPREVAS